MESKIKDIILINNYLTNCKLDDPTSKQSELTMKLLNYRVREALEYRKNPKSKPVGFIKSILSLIF